MHRTIIHCHNCQQRLKIPSGLGGIRVTCPKCRACWDEETGGQVSLPNPLFSRLSRTNRYLLYAAVGSLVFVIVAWLMGGWLNRDNNHEPPQTTLAQLPNRRDGDETLPANAIQTQPEKLPVDNTPAANTKPTAPFVRITHITRYDYDGFVTLLPQKVRLSPTSMCRTPISDFNIRIVPEPKVSQTVTDELSNSLFRYLFIGETNKFEIKVQFSAHLVKTNPLDTALDKHADKYPFSYDKDKRKELGRYMTFAPAGALLRRFLADLPQAEMSTVEFVLLLNNRVHKAIRYEERLEAGVWEPEETLAKQKGACRDSAYLLAEILRQKGLAARYVGGYLISPKDDNYVVDLHAWVEVYLPGAGWVGLDPTGGNLAAEGHIPLAYGVHPRDTAPVEGSFSAAGDVNAELHFEMKAAVLK
jgi:transglutaminase-like putative cysteine protease